MRRLLFHDAAAARRQHAATGTKKSNMRAADGDVASVAREFGARYILVDRSLNPRLTDLLRARMPEVYQDSAISLFEPAP